MGLLEATTSYMGNGRSVLNFRTGDTFLVTDFGAVPNFIRVITSNGKVGYLPNDETKIKPSINQSKLAEQNFIDNLVDRLCKKLNEYNYRKRQAQSLIVTLLIQDLFKMRFLISMYGTKWTKKVKVYHTRFNKPKKGNITPTSVSERNFPQHLIKNDKEDPDGILNNKSSTKSEISHNKISFNDHLHDSSCEDSYYISSGSPDSCFAPYPNESKLNFVRFTSDAKDQNQSCTSLIERIYSFAENTKQELNVIDCDKPSFESSNFAKAKLNHKDFDIKIHCSERMINNSVYNSPLRIFYETKRQSNGENSSRKSSNQSFQNESNISNYSEHKLPFQINQNDNDIHKLLSITKQRKSQIQTDRLFCHDASSSSSLSLFENTNTPNATSSLSEDNVQDINSNDIMFYVLTDSISNNLTSLDTAYVWNLFNKLQVMIKTVDIIKLEKVFAIYGNPLALNISDYFSVESRIILKNALLEFIYQLLCNIQNFKESIAKTPVPIILLYEFHNGNDSENEYKEKIIEILGKLLDIDPKILNLVSLIDDAFIMSLMKSIITSHSAGDVAPTNFIHFLCNICENHIVAKLVVKCLDNSPQLKYSFLNSIGHFMTSQNRNDLKLLQFLQSLITTSSKSDSFIRPENLNLLLGKLVDKLCSENTENDVVTLCLDIIILILTNPWYSVSSLYLEKVNNMLIILKNRCENLDNENKKKISKATSILSFYVQNDSTASGDHESHASCEDDYRKTKSEIAISLRKGRKRN